VLSFVRKLEFCRKKPHNKFWYCVLLVSPLTDGAVCTVGSAQGFCQSTLSEESVPYVHLRMLRKIKLGISNGHKIDRCQVIFSVLCFAVSSVMNISVLMTLNGFCE